MSWIDVAWTMMAAASLTLGLIHLFVWYKNQSQYVYLVGARVRPLAGGMLSDTLTSSAGPQSLRYALLAMPVLLVWSAFHFARGAGTIQ